MSEIFPSILPAPTIAFAGSADASTIVTKMESGRSRSRKRFTRQGRSYNVHWEMNEYQFGMFQAWFKHLINDGADEFLIDLPTGGEGLKTVLAKFANGKYSFSHKPVLFWNVTATLQVEDPLVFSLEDYNTLLLVDIIALEEAVAIVDEYITS